MNIECGSFLARPGEPLLIVPAFVKALIEREYQRRTDKAPNLTLGQWLRAQPDGIRRREDLRLLGKLGLVAL